MEAVKLCVLTRCVFYLSPSGYSTNICIKITISPSRFTEQADELFQFVTLQLCVLTMVPHKSSFKPP